MDIIQSDPALRLYAEKAGIHFAYDMVTDLSKFANDAQPTLITTPGGAIPALLSTYIDPDVLETRVSPMKFAEIIGEKKIGDWTMDTAMFPISEGAGEVTSYGDTNQDGTTSANFQWPQRQNYRYQTVMSYGDLEVEKIGLTKMSLIAELQKSRARNMAKFENKAYAYGVAGLQNYGLLNDPALPGTITPGTKAAGHGNVWVYNGQVTATALEIYNDVQSMYIQAISQSAGVIDGLIEVDDEMVLAMHPTTSVAMTALVALTGTTSVEDMLKKTFPKLRIETAVEYSTASGYLVQMIFPMAAGQQTSYAAFSEKMRAHRMVPLLSSMQQKVSGGVWGAVNRQPWAIVGLLGV